MERKGKGSNNYEALQKCSRNDFVSKNFVFNFQSCYIFWQALPFLVDQCPFGRKQKQTFLPCLSFFSVGEELTLLSLHGKIQSRSFKATSDDTRGLLAGNFRPLSPLFSFRYYSSRSLGPLVGWISLETPPFTTFLSFTRSSRCLWCRNAENICAGRGRLKLLVSSPAKGAPFLSKLFLTSEVRKSWGMVAFWNCFFTRKWHNTSNLSVLLSK